jgi:hypothetical protein
MINFLCYHYKISNDDIKKLTVHQFNQKVEFLNKIFSDKKPENKSSNNYGVLDKAYGVK